MMARRKMRRPLIIRPMQVIRRILQNTLNYRYFLALAAAREDALRVLIRDRVRGPDDT